MKKYALLSLLVALLTACSSHSRARASTYPTSQYFHHLQEQTEHQELINRVYRHGIHKPYGERRAHYEIKFDD